MTENMQKPTQPGAEATRFIDHSLSQLCDAIADPDHRSGGGAIAALSIAGSAAIVELVLSLAARRASMIERRPEIDAQLERVHTARHRLFALIDEDLAAFDRVMKIQADLKAASDQEKDAIRESLDRAFLEATMVPIDVAQIGRDLLTTLRDALPLATRFTISDLGSAATIINGAIEAGLLTADINLNYIPPERRPELEQRVARIRSEAPELAALVLETTRDRITRKGSGRQP